MPTRKGRRRRIESDDGEPEKGCGYCRLKPNALGAIVSKLAKCKGRRASGAAAFLLRRVPFFDGVVNHADARFKMFKNIFKFRFSFFIWLSNDTGG